MKTTTKASVTTVIACANDMCSASPNELDTITRKVRSLGLGKPVPSGPGQRAWIERAYREVIVDPKCRAALDAILARATEPPTGDKIPVFIVPAGVAAAVIGAELLIIGAIAIEMADDDFWEDPTEEDEDGKGKWDRPILK